jgi:hypothetical protein
MFVVATGAGSVPARQLVVTYLVALPPYAVIVRRLVPHRRRRAMS